MRNSRLLAIGGITGPAVFIGSWAALGAILDNYSPIADAISELARVGRSTRPAMSAAFVGYGISMAAFAVPIKKRFGNKTAAATLVNAAATVGVAAASLGSPTSDAVHTVFAATAYVSLAAMPLLSAAQQTEIFKRLSVITGAAIALALIASVTAPDDIHGLFQRLGLTIGDVWIVSVAITLLRRNS